MIRFLPVILLVACGGEGTWDTEIWGEAFIEEGIPASVFDDGCSVAFSRFLVVTADLALVGDDGTPAAEAGGPWVHDLVAPGPQVLATLTAPVGTWRGMDVSIAPASEPAGDVDADALAALDGGSLWVEGSLTCGEDTVAFGWRLETGTAYACDPENLVVSSGAAASTQLTVHGDHLFYDSLVDPDAGLRGQALVDADADRDGILTEAELTAAPVAPTGYTVGDRADVTDLWAYLEAQTRSIGHVDGEGHCAVTELE